MHVPGTAPLRIGLIAPEGRMGQALAREIDAEADLERDDANAQVLIDFSAPAALPATLDRALAAAVPAVIGTTGLDVDAHQRMDEAARRVPLLYAPNTSLGVALLRMLVEQAAARLEPEWDVEILDVHHRHKVDAPSGTALLLGAAAAKGRGGGAELNRFDRLGGNAPREPGTIGYAALRGGSAAGDHDVIFAGEGERLILSHRAESRMIFVRGALAAARWVVRQPPGRYAMSDVLGADVPGTA